jgi:hypothetical protein
VRSEAFGSAYLVFPSVVGLVTMGSLSLDLVWKIKKGLGDGELLLNLIYRDSMVHKGKESSRLCSVDQLPSDLLFSGVKVYRVLTFLVLR